MCHFWVNTSCPSSNKLTRLCCQSGGSLLTQNSESPVNEEALQRLKNQEKLSLFHPSSELLDLEGTFLHLLWGFTTQFICQGVRLRQMQVLACSGMAHDITVLSESIMWNTKSWKHLKIMKNKQVQNYTLEGWVVIALLIAKVLGWFQQHDANTTA